MFSKFSDMHKKAEELKQQMEKMHLELKEKRIEGLSVKGYIKVVLNGEKELIDIQIDKECVNDIEGLRDLIIDAFKNASSKVESSQDFSSLKSIFPF